MKYQVACDKIAQEIIDSYGLSKKSYDFVVHRMEMACAVGYEQGWHDRAGPPKQIVQLTKEGAIVKVWPSIRQAAKALGTNDVYIGRCARGVGSYKTCKGFKWKYTDKLNT